MSIPKTRIYDRQKLTRLDYCNAHFNDSMLLSYDTPVIYEGNKFIYVDYAQQTVTTKKHIRQFLKHIRNSNRQLYNFLYMYLHNWRDSGYTKLLYDKRYDHLIFISTMPELQTL